MSDTPTMFKVIGWSGGDDIVGLLSMPEKVVETLRYRGRVSIMSPRSIAAEPYYSAATSVIENDVVTVHLRSQRSDRVHIDGVKAKNLSDLNNYDGWVFIPSVSYILDKIKAELQE